MSWYCPAFEKSITFFPDGKIRPCCETDFSYYKPIEDSLNPDRFKDLLGQEKPQACRKCWEAEEQGHYSYRNYFQKYSDSSNIEFIDLRNSNQCNLKCRYCHSHYSNQWAKELGELQTLKHTNLDFYLDKLLTEDLKHVYLTGGEPLIIQDNFRFIKKLIDLGLSPNISLQYNTNLSSIEYKGQPYINLWKKFKSVRLYVSIDTVDFRNNFIRSNSDWNFIEGNINSLLPYQNKQFRIVLSPVISLLNIWFLKKLADYAKNKNLTLEPIVLTGPDFLSVSALPYSLKEQVKDILHSIEGQIEKSFLNQTFDLLKKNDQHLFGHTLQHILLLDSMRNEKLFNELPFKQYAIDTILQGAKFD